MAQKESHVHDFEIMLFLELEWFTADVVNEEVKDCKLIDDQLHWSIIDEKQYDENCSHQAAYYRLKDLACHLSFNIVRKGIKFLLKHLMIDHILFLVVD